MLTTKTISFQQSQCNAGWIFALINGGTGVMELRIDGTTEIELRCQKTNVVRQKGGR